LIAAADTVLLPVVVLGELQAGFEMGNRYRENSVALSEFLRESFVGILPVTEAVARRYSRIFAQLKASGTPIPTNDIWIASCAAEAAGMLITFDRHFEKVPGLSRTILGVSGEP